MIRYSKKGPARYTAHLDLMRVLERAMRRAELPVAFSEGFNPHPKMSIAAPLPVGTEGLAELAEVELNRPVEPAELTRRLNDNLPEGLEVRESMVIPGNAPALMAALDRATYIVNLDTGDISGGITDRALRDFMALDRVEVTRRGKDGREKTRDIRPGILKMDLLPGGDREVTLRLELKTGSAMNVRPAEVLAALFARAGINADPADALVTRTGLHLAE